MAELATILAHNMLKGATFLTTNEIVGHELDRMADGYRHTWWEAPSTASQVIEFRAPSLVFNFGFENNTNDWHLVTAAAGAGTMARNTASPLAGAADVSLTTTVADAAADVVFITNLEPLFFKAGRTYRMMFKSKAITANKNIRYGFLDEDYIEDVALYSTGLSQTSGTGFYKDITPTTDGWYHVYVRLEEVGEVHFDDFICNELRNVNTLCIDAGHTISNAAIEVQYRDKEEGAYIVALAAFQHQNREPVYKTFTLQTALSWKIVITVFTAVAAIPVAQVPLVGLGERWDLPHQFLGSFDPYESRKMVNTKISERGIKQDTLKYNQRIFKATMPNITPDEYASLQYFYEDTENGLHPFFYIWKPTTIAWDVVPMLMRRGELAPYTWFNRRQWTLDAEEVVGKRKI